MTLLLKSLDERFLLCTFQFLRQGGVSDLKMLALLLLYFEDVPRVFCTTCSKAQGTDTANNVYIIHSLRQRKSSCLTEATVVFTSQVF